MAFVKPSALISDIKGKLNGSYFQSKKNGITVNNINSRNKGKFTANVQVQKQKGNVAYVSKAWRGLTNAQRATWGTAASSMTRVNKNGVEYVPTGYQIFLQYNLNLLSIDEAIINTYSEAEEAVDMSKIGILGSETQRFVLENNSSLTAASAIKVYATPPQSKGVVYPRGSYRQITFVSGDTPTTNLGSPYAARFGAVQPGQTVFFKIIVITIASGKDPGAKLTKADAG